MGIIRNLFGSKSDKSDSKGKDQFKFSYNLENRIPTIYPYFKQVLEPTGESIPLPSDFSQIDKSQTYDASKVELITKSIIADLRCFYVLDNKTGYEYIQQKHLDSVGLNADKLHEHALDNFRRLLQSKFSTNGNENQLMFLVDGNLEASLILLDEIWEQAYDHFKEEIVICAPSRDVLLATGKSKTEVIQNISTKAIDVLKSGDHPLSKYWFLRKDNKWEVYGEIRSFV